MNTCVDCTSKKSLHVNLEKLLVCDQTRRSIFYAKTDVGPMVSLCASLKDRRTFDIEFYTPFVRDVCLRHWGSLPAKVVPIENGGTFHVIFQIHFSSDKNFVIRFNRLSDQHTAYEFLIDKWVYPLLKRSNLSSIEFVDIDFSRTACPSDYEIVTLASGKTLTSFQNEQTQYMHPGLLRNIGKYVARVHNIKLKGFGPLSFHWLNKGEAQGIHDTWLEYILLRLDEHVEICHRIGALNDKEAQRIRELFLDYQNLFTNIEASLLHGDLGNHNLFSRDGKSISALIDWEDCLSGDPVFDIAFWGTFFKDNMREYFLRGYIKVRSLSDDFEVRYWLYYLRISLSKTVHRFHFGYPDRPGRPLASLRIQKALDRLRQLGIS